MITYRYLVDGTKVCAEAVLQSEIDEGDGYTPAKIYRRCYKGSFTHVTDPDTGEESLESIVWKEGMLVDEGLGKAFLAAAVASRPSFWEQMTLRCSRLTNRDQGTK